MNNLQRVAIVAASIGLGAAGVATSANAQDTNRTGRTTAAMTQAAQAEEPNVAPADPAAWPVMAARIAYLGAKHAASTPAVRAQYSNALRAAGGVFRTPAIAPNGSKVSPSVDVVFDR